MNSDRPEVKKMSRGNATDRGAVFELVELKGKKKDVMATADEESHYQSLTLNREAAKKAESVYMVPMPRNKELVEAKITCEPKEELNLQNSKNAGLQHQVKSPDKKFLAKLCLFFVILGIGIIFVAFITLVSFAVYNYKEVQIKEDMLEKLRQQVENLEEQNEAQARAMNTTREKLNSIDMMLRSTIESTSTSLFSINASLHTTQDQLEEHFTEAQRSISSIAMDVANLNDSRVNFSQNCHRESRSCTSDTADYYDDYSLDCRTGQLSINRTVSYTLL